MTTQIKLILITVASLFFICEGHSNDVVYKMGTFNIRLRTTSDTGDLHWDNRKTYVARTITEFGYDVIGLNEITSGVQKSDIQNMLPDYSFVMWGVQSSVVPDTGNSALNAIAYRTDKFDLLEEGHFFLSADPEKAIISWDSSQKRVTVWVKLKDKITNNIFYFFATHMDHVGDIARREGANINLEKIREITGNYPVFLVGDFNSSPVRLAFYNTLCAYMNDSRKVTETPFPKRYDGTLNKWDPTNLNTSRLDHVFSRGARILSYDHITETFGRSVTPSDHLPVIITCILNDYKAEHSVYVNQSASPNGNGTKNSPFNNIQDAVNAIDNGDTIKIAQGTYTVTESEGHTGRNACIYLNKSATIIGGYESSFEEIVGRSVISGDLSGNDLIENGKIVGNEENAYQVIMIESPYALELNNCDITGGNANESPYTLGAGINALGAKLKLENVNIYNNYSTAGGAGIQVAGKLICNRCLFENNITGGKGGAIYMTDNQWWRHSVTNSFFNGNEATQGAAGYITGLTSGFFECNTFTNNKASSSGILSFFGKEVNSTITFVNNTFINNNLKASNGLLNKSNGGSAVYFSLKDESVVNLVNNTIIGNSASCYVSQEVPATNFYGAAVHMISGKLNLFNNIIAGNYSTSVQGGDIYNEGTLENTQYNAFSSADNMTITAGNTDKMQSSYSNSITMLGNMFESRIDNNTLIPILEDNGGYVPTVKLISPRYGNIDLNTLTLSDLSESTLNVDIDDDFQIKSGILKDQRGELRSTDGKSMIGAFEYGVGLSAPAVKDNFSPVIWCNSHTLYIKTTRTLSNIRIYSLNGNLIADQIHLENDIIKSIDISGLRQGIYILSWEEGSKSFLKK